MMRALRVSLFDLLQPSENSTKTIVSRDQLYLTINISNTCLGVLAQRFHLQYRQYLSVNPAIAYFNDASVGRIVLGLEIAEITSPDK